MVKMPPELSVLDLRIYLLFLNNFEFEQKIYKIDTTEIPKEKELARNNY